MEGALPSPAAVMESHVLSVLPRCPFSSLKGRWRKLERLQGTESSQGTHIHQHSCSHKLQVHHSLASLALEAKPQLRSMAGLGWACPSARIQPRAKHSTLINNLLPSLLTGRARGSSPFAGEGSLFREGRCWGVFHCCWFASDLVCVIRLQTPHPEHPVPAVPSEAPPLF